MKKLDNAARFVHHQVEYCVENAAGVDRHFDTFNDAAGLAVAMAASGKENVYIDVLIYDEDGARFYGGDDAVEQYRENPEASVFERFEIKVNSMGRVQ